MQQNQLGRIETEFPRNRAKVRVVEYTYLVDFGPETLPRFHVVNKLRQCSCKLGKTCPAIEAVLKYLRNGGQRAPDPMPSCPMCGADTIRDRELDGKYTKELGWRCSTGGVTHFLQAKAERIKEAIRLRQIAACEHENLTGR
jgi:hypothetical protein